MGLMGAPRSIYYLYYLVNLGVSGGGPISADLLVCYADKSTTGIKSTHLLIVPKRQVVQRQ